jgi:hypothetical protein
MLEGFGKRDEFEIQRSSRLVISALVLADLHLIPSATVLAS